MGPGGMAMQPPGGPGRPGPEGMMGPGGPPFGPLLRMLAQRKPQLAQRLERLRERDPSRFEDVLMDAFALRLDELLDKAEREHPAGTQPEGPRPSGKGMRLPGEGPRPPGEGMRPPMMPGRPGGEMGGRASGPMAGMPGEPVDPHMRELQERQEKLEARARELATKLRQPEGAGPEDRKALRDELGRVVNEQFDVRSELRKTELSRIEQELNRLRERLERTRQDLEHRERERGAIIERRIEQLVGGDGGW